MLLKGAERSGALLENLERWTERNVFIGKLAFFTGQKKNRNNCLTRLGSTIRLNTFI